MKHSEGQPITQPDGEGNPAEAQETAATETETAPKAGLTRARILGASCLAIAGTLALSAILFKDDNGVWLGEEIDPIIKAAPVIAVAADEEPLPPLVNEVDATFNRGDTMMAVMTRAGVDRVEAHKAIQAMTPLFNPREIKAGQKLSLILEDDPDTGEARLTRLKLKADKTRNIVVTPDGQDGFAGEAVDIPITTELVRSQGVIDSSLYAAAVENDVPLKVLADMINIFSFDVDFQREVQRDDSFQLMFERMADDQGNAVDHGDVLLAEMVLSGEKRRFYRYEDKNGFVDYYDEKGRSVRKALLKTPVDGARISSKYGKRKHPVLGYTKKHSGVDFAAPRGTPIYAAGDGVLEAAGRNGSYGIYIRIRHNDSYKTAYAHMSKLAKGMRKGKRVRQRQVIGYVGTTGRSTGPHLHFEVHKGGRKVNPLGVKLPTGKTLKGKALAAFQQERARIDGLYASLPGSAKVADATPDSQ
ncbi:M23 family metallopeptidase [Aestuariispira insulae]|uniref:Murein DD-endopeptidase MepM/ murein hydrolase activator NlpD n=1 Tax=Aestuariispira insulae TaxID=1461337 RepID=A0A3D9HFX4_9PROT|nr:M23 family metallopeptidase [Aestuariispira insulae]RED48161.1 murein DD-endopeptidase MepM/ murein hydrolase activator NlpD [Aestuariispira insulae]